MESEKYIAALTSKIECLLSLSITRPLMRIQDAFYFFYIYKPVNNEELKKKGFSNEFITSFDKLLDVMLVNREAYFAQFKKEEDIELLIEKGYKDARTLTFLLFKKDYNALSEKGKNRFIIQQQLRSNHYHLN